MHQNQQKTILNIRNPLLIQKLKPLKNTKKSRWRRYIEDLRFIFDSEKGHWDTFYRQQGNFKKSLP